MMDNEPLLTSLRWMSSSISPPSMVQAAQETLLAFENDHVDEYVNCLLSLLGTTSTDATLRLSAILALKAAISRRWKDCGHGGRANASTNSREEGKKKYYLSENVKQLVRISILNLVIGQQQNSNNIVNNENITINFDSQQLELLQDRQLQHNAASLLSKLGRLDLPLKFQTLIPTLVHAIKWAQEMMIATTTTTARQLPCHHNAAVLKLKQFQLIQYNAMNALEATLSEMSTQRLLVDKKYRHSTFIQYFGCVVKYGFIPSLNNLQVMSRQVFANGEERIIVNEEQSDFFMVKYATLACKVVCHMLNSSLSKLVSGNDSETANGVMVDNAMTLTHKFLSEWLPRIIENNNNAPCITSENFTSTTTTLVEAMNELLQVHCDMIMTIQNSHAISFIRYLEQFLNLFYSSLMTMVERRNCMTSSPSPIFDGLIICFLKFLGNVVCCEDAAVASIVWVNFFSPQLILLLSRTLLHLFHNINGDSHQWKDDSEAFFQWEVQRSSDEDVGSAAQNLFVALVESNPLPDDSLLQGGEKVVLPWLIDMLGNVASQRLAVEIEGGISRNVSIEIIQKAMPLGATVHSHNATAQILSREFVMQWDVLYTAAGLAGTMLEGHLGFHFGTWFENCLGPNLSILQTQQKNEYQILPVLQRRLIWLISCNANQINISSNLNPLGLIATALSRSNDICLRLTAVQAMDAMLPNCEDAPHLLYSITVVSIPALYQLTNYCDEVESRASCLDMISNIITYVSYTGGKLSADLLNEIVAPLSTIWKNATDQNLLLRRNVLSIASCVASFVGPDEAAVLYPLALPMIDDSFGRDENAFLVDEALKIWWVFLQLSSEYDPLLGKLYLHAPLLSKDLENVKVLMRITEFYIILGREGFLIDHATTVQAVLRCVIGEISPRGTAYVGLVLEALLRLFPSEGGKMLDCCGITEKCLRACGNNYFGIDSCDPDRVIVIYMTALARMFFVDPDLLQSKLPISLQSGTFGHAQLVNLYVTRFQVAGNGAHGLLFQTLWGMLLLSFLPPSPFHRFTMTQCVLEKANDIFSAFVYLLRNVDTNLSNIISYEVEFDDETRIDRNTLCAYDALVLEQTNYDKLHCSNFRRLLREKLDSLSVAEYNRLLSMLDNDIVHQIITLAT